MRVVADKLTEMNPFAKVTYNLDHTLQTILVEENLKDKYSAVVYGLQNF